jgi:hypothetical protein
MGMGIVDDIASSSYGWDRHAWDVPPDELESKF